jgi:hypothetical protein
MYDGAVAAAIEMFQLNSSLSSIPNAFQRYVVRGLSRGMLRIECRTWPPDISSRPGWKTESWEKAWPLA